MQSLTEISSTFLFISHTGFVVSLLLRLLGGEYYLNFKAAIKWPWYDEASNLQHFPFRTVSMLIGLILILVVSYLFKWLFESGKLASKYDVFNAVVNERKTTVKYTTNLSDESTDDVEFHDMKKKGEDNQGVEHNDEMI